MEQTQLIILTIIRDFSLPDRLLINSQNSCKINSNWTVCFKKKIFHKMMINIATSINKTLLTTTPIITDNVDLIKILWFFVE